MLIDTIAYKCCMLLLSEEAELFDVVRRINKRCTLERDYGAAEETVKLLETYIKKFQEIQPLNDIVPRYHHQPNRDEVHERRAD